MNILKKTFLSFYPNPVKRVSSLHLQSNAAAAGTLSVFSITGRQVRFLEFEEGSHSLND